MLEGSLLHPPADDTSMMDGCEDTAVSEPLPSADGSIDNNISDCESEDSEYQTFRNDLNDLLCSTGDSADTLAEEGTVQQEAETRWKNFHFVGLSDLQPRLAADIGQGGPTADPTQPASVWKPSRSIAEWAKHHYGLLPAALRTWIDRFEPSMCGGWASMVSEKREMLPVLSTFATSFQPVERKGAIQWLFKKKGIPSEQVAELDGLWAGLPATFGLADFRVDDDTTQLRWVMSVADCFLSLVDDAGFSKSIRWDPFPNNVDPTDFRAGGIHEPDAQRNWARMPGVSSWVRTWVQEKVWFKKNAPHQVDHSASNAACLNPSGKWFDQEKFSFVDRKIQELVHAGAVVECGELPDVLTRLSVAPKAGKEKFRIILDMRPENMAYSSKHVRMEHLGHFSSVFSKDDFAFSCDLKSAYFSVLVDIRLGRTMGFKWGGKFYRFTCLPFGFKLAPYAFVKIGRQVLKKWRAVGPGEWQARFWNEPALRGGARCMLYIDDSIGGHKIFAAAVWLRNAMIKELEDLGFSMSSKGDLLPFRSIRFLGLIAHLAGQVPSWHVPAEKMEALLALVEELENKAAVDVPAAVQRVAKCVGKLLSVSRAIPVAQLMSRELNRVIYSNGVPDWKGSVSLAEFEGAWADLQWMLEALGPFNQQGTPIWAPSKLVHVQLTQDAGPWAAGFESQVEGAAGAATVHGGTIEFTEEEHELEHVHKELWGLYLTLSSQRGVLAGKRLSVQVDSTTTVHYLTEWRGGSSELLCNMVKLIWALCIRFNICITQVVHITGTHMVAAGVDAKSRPSRFARGHECHRDDWRLTPQCFLWLQQQVGAAFTIDRMATRSSALCWRFNSVNDADPDRSQLPGAFANNWRVDETGQPEFNYVFPPFSLIPRVLAHVRECAATAVVIVPQWPSQLWWVEAMSMAAKVVVLPKHCFQYVKDGTMTVVDRMPFQAVALLVDGQPSTHR